MTGENWTNEQWYDYARQTYEAELRQQQAQYWQQEYWARQEEHRRNKMHYGYYDDRWDAMKSGFMDLLLLPFSWFFGPR